MRTLIHTWHDEPVPTSPVVAFCPACHAFAVVALPDWAAATQPDGTTHVCHPDIGGCNQGFELIQDHASKTDH